MTVYTYFLCHLLVSLPQCLGAHLHHSPETAFSNLGDVVLQSRRAQRAKLGSITNPSFSGLSFYLLQNKYEKNITLFLHHWAPFSVMYVLIHQPQEASEWGRWELECSDKSPAGGYNYRQLLTRLELLLPYEDKASSVSVIPTSIWKLPENPLFYSRLWNFNPIKIWRRDMGLYSQMAIWYKSSVKCRNRIN